jgi:hypothetical protein
MKFSYFLFPFSMRELILLYYIPVIYWFSLTIFISIYLSLQQNENREALTASANIALRHTRRILPLPLYERYYSQRRLFVRPSILVLVVHGLLWRVDVRVDEYLVFLILRSRVFANERPTVASIFNVYGDSGECL